MADDRSNTTEKPDPAPAEDIDRRLDQLSEEIDDLEKYVLPPTPKPAPIDGMF